jgi:hypothetical protein
VLLTRITRSTFGSTAPLPAHSGVGSERRLRRLAVVSLVCWTAAITAGRLLAYTYSHLTAADF